MARDCPRGKPTTAQPFSGGVMGLGEAEGRPEPEKREKTERQIKTTLDNEKLKSQSIGSKLSIYCEQLQSRVGRDFFPPPLTHTSPFARVLLLA